MEESKDHLIAEWIEFRKELGGKITREGLNIDLGSIDAVSATLLLLHELRYGNSVAATENLLRFFQIDVANYGIPVHVRNK